jgi:hypothetical protein
VIPQVGVSESPESVIPCLVVPGVLIHVFQVFQRRVQMAPYDIGRRYGFAVPG